LGDVGPKLGDGANDTGFMRLTNVRVPRERMLCKYQQVNPEGMYIKAEEKTNDKMHYATMMFTRGSMVKMAGGFLARGVTIATRYSCVRQQGFVNTAKDVSYRSPENAIIEYQVQRYRLFRQLALAYAMKFTGKWMIDRFKDLEGSGAGIIVDTAALPEIAATSAGLKAFCTYLTSQGIEDCRKCCGGNGYLTNSGVGALSQDYVWQTTAEGDFIVLMLQTARFLMKSLRDARAKKPVAGFVEYLVPCGNPGFNPLKVAPQEAKTVKDLFNLEYLSSLFKYRAMMAVLAVGDELARQQQGGKSFDEAWNTAAVQLCDAVKAHCYAFMVSTFIQAVKTVEDKKVQAVLSRVCALFALSNIQDDQWAGFGVVGVEMMRLVRTAVAQLLDELRPDAVSLVDAFDIPDRVLNSTIGMHDGNVYEALYEAAKKSNLNDRDPFDGYSEVLRPRLDIELLKLGNSKL
jgi:acyl-CoA oxidase